MTDASPSTIVGCLLDVSASMREALETDGSDERANDRLSAVLVAALKLAQSQNHHNSEALIFVSVFGLDNNNKEHPKAIDLCEAADALLRLAADPRSGHDLIDRAKEKGVPDIAKYIQREFLDGQARIIYAYLTRHPSEVDEFMEALASSSILPTVQAIPSTTKTNGRGDSTAVVRTSYPGAQHKHPGYFGNVVSGANEVIHGMKALHDKVEEEVESKYMEWWPPAALSLARGFFSRWVKDFSIIKPRPVGEVIRLLARLQERTNDVAWLKKLRESMYGQTPMQHALGFSLEIFKRHPEIKDRVLIVISDGFSTDGDLMPVARSLQQANVSIASIYLTSNQAAAERFLHYQPAKGWHHGQRVLFDMASRVAGVAHPIPALASMGWSIPSAGEIALHATVSTSVALNEICSLLLSARFGSANLLLDLVGRFELDEYINDENIRGCQNPSNQGQEPTCYAHAAAAVICMAMSRISGRKGGYDDIETVRQRILEVYPTGPNGRNARDVLEDATSWYRLRVLEVDEDAASFDKMVES
ncbi:hypothetical protein CABS03_10654 [Colletotrichum abscissum]|uniref:VWFA domain-containing protein n=2 Tax=Colletotrichum acutatum species complex TaxID=2707335 RepID=A0A9P9X288_9PEZI|nr:hypothetical protein CABS02_13980 [Colletotrichum abscissum]KAK0368612.1 hypothetical protein CLIM01_14034 [Colletotrichum limetticola]